MSKYQLQLKCEELEAHLAAATAPDQRRRVLSAEEQIELRNALQGAPPDGGAWTGGKVAQWMAAKTGRPVHRQRGCEYLRRLTAGTEREGDERPGEP